MRYVLIKSDAVIVYTGDSIYPKIREMGGGSIVSTLNSFVYIFKKLLQSPFSDTISYGKLDQLSMSNVYTNQLHSVLSLL